MGMDMCAIIDHNRTANELLRLPELISSSVELKSLFSKQHNNALHKLEDCYWKGNYPMTEDNLQVIWNSLRNDTELPLDLGMNHFSEIDTYFGEIKVYEKTINVSPFPEHKYRNLRLPLTSEYIFTLNRIIAKILGSMQIVYCCDSYYYPELIQAKSMSGLDTNSIIDFGNMVFGKPPKELNAAIENLYFIDRFDLQLDELNPEKEVWSRAKFEYDKGQQGELPYKKEWIES